MPNRDDDNEDPNFTVPEFAQEVPRAHDGRYVRGLSFRISELLIRGNRADFDLGALIDEVFTENLWARWPGENNYTRFEDWSWGVLGCRVRKAHYLRDNWRALQAMNLSDFALTSAIRVGWSKLKEILRVARNEVDLLSWCDRVNARNPQTGHPMSEKALRLAIVEAGAETRPDQQGPSSRVHAKIVFRDAEAYASVMEVVSIIKRRFSPEMGDGEALTLMATNYLSAYPTDSDGGAAVELDMVLQRIEAHYRLKLVPVEIDRRPPQVQQPARQPETSNDAAVSI